jgi:hypothetical protein
LAVVALAGQGLWQLLLGGLLAAGALGGYCLVDRRRLRLDELLQLRRR